MGARASDETPKGTWVPVDVPASDRLVPVWMLFLPNDEQDYALALVEVARAAREFVQFAGDDAEGALVNLGDPKTDFERDVKHAAQLTLALRAALERLDGPDKEQP